MALRTASGRSVRPARASAYRSSAPIPPRSSRRGCTIGVAWGGTLALALLASAGTPLHAQHAHTEPVAPGHLAGWAHVVFLGQSVSPVLSGERRNEMVATQPMLGFTVRSAGGRAGLRGIASLEGLTLANGEASPGVWGEGFVDRRHPHTYAHELAGWLAGHAGPVGVSLSAGRGFVPFGSDDPMFRPFVRFPANHHLSHILERWFVGGAARAGAITLEAALFNGDEPEGPTDLGGIERLGDSGAARLTVARGPVEAGASLARLRSPEWRAGRGADHHKWNATVRAVRIPMGDARLYTLVEWSRTDLIYRGERAFRFSSVLAEVEAASDRGSAAFSVERTERPEGQRVGDPFRVARPHVHPNVVGITRWTIVSARGEAPVRASSPGLRVFAEVARFAVEELTGSHFRPDDFYGSDRMHAIALGLRVHAGSGPGARSGRYGLDGPLPPGGR